MSRTIASACKRRGQTRLDATMQSATEATPIFVQQGVEPQGPMLVLSPHAKLGRSIRC